VQLPGPGPMTHTGADGRGEVFYLDRGFTDEGVGAGFTTIRPFAQGSGEHIWTLYMPDIPWFRWRRRFAPVCMGADHRRV